MFLFAKIVLENLGDQISVFDFKNELKAKNFPEGLDKAYVIICEEYRVEADPHCSYERVVKRVLKNPIKPQRLAAEQILGWVVSAERPLRWREIQSRFCIDPEAGTVNIDRKPINSCKYLCGSLVELGMTETMSDPDSEGEVEMVHSSAKEYVCHIHILCCSSPLSFYFVSTPGTFPDIEKAWHNLNHHSYLIQTQALCLVTEHARTALFCAQYLTSPPLRLCIEGDIQACALTGYYGYHDYATAFWWNHVDKLIEARKMVSFDTYRRTLQSVAKLLTDYLISTGMCDEELRDLDAIALKFEELPRNPREREKALSLELSTERVRGAIEAIEEGEDKTYTVGDIVILPLYGSIRYKCPKPWCQLFSSGFAKPEQRNDHVNEHDRPFRCSIEGCYLVDIGYPTEPGLNQHIKRHHTQPETALFPKPRTPGKRKGDIFAATEEGNLNTVKDLVASGININKTKWAAKGETTLMMLAVGHGHLDVCKFLLENGANADLPAVSDGDSILHEAIRRDDTEIIELLLKQDKIALGVTVQGLTGLGLAPPSGSNRLLSLFKVTKSQVFDKEASQGQKTQLNQTRTAQMLLRGDKTRMCISQSFLDTLSKASDAMLKLLLPLDWPEDNSQTGSWCPLLHIACRRGDIRLARRLISLDNQPDRQDHTGCTPLAIAADLGLIDIVLMLLSSGRVDLWRLNTDEDSILAKCANYDIRIAEIFLEADPSLATKSDPDGATLLYHAYQEKNWDLIRFLIQMDVDVNTLLQSHLSYKRVSSNIDPASENPLRMALELGSLALNDRHRSTTFANELEWEAESIILLCQALVASDKVDLSSLETREELQYLALAAKMESKSLTWSLVERGLLYSWSGPCCTEGDVPQLMFVLKENIELLLAVATDKALLSDTLKTLLVAATYENHRGSLLTLIGWNRRLAKDVLRCDSVSVDATKREEILLAREVLEETVRKGDDDLIHRMIHRGFDGNMAMLLAAESGTIEMVEAILQTGKVDLNFTNSIGERLEDVAYCHGNFATHERLKRARLNSMIGKDSIARMG